MTEHTEIVEENKTTKKAKALTSTLNMNLESSYSFYLVNEETSEIMATFSKLELIKEDTTQITLSKGLIDRFQLVKYLRPKSIKEVIEAQVSKFPKLKLVFDAASYINSKELNSLIKTALNSRLELESLCVKRIEISLLPGDKMAVNCLEFEPTELNLTSIPTEIHLSNYKSKALWRTLTFNEIEPNYLAASDFI